MSPIAPSRQSQTAFNEENADIPGSSSTLLEVPRRNASMRKWKSVTQMSESKKKSSPPLRHTSLAIDIDTANNVPYDDIDGLTDEGFTQSLYYSPELAAIVSSGGRSKRWAFWFPPTPRLHRDKGDTMADRNTKSEEEGSEGPTLYLILDPDQDPSNLSEVRMLVGTSEELRRETGGGDVFEKGLPM